jgi:hypothetical protein
MTIPALIEGWAHHGFAGGARQQPLQLTANIEQTYSDILCEVLRLNCSEKLFERNVEIVNWISSTRGANGV